MAWKKTWVFVPRATAFPPKAKREVDEKAAVLVEELKKSIRKPPKNPRYNYVADVYAKWRGNHSFYLCARYNCPGKNAISPSFERNFARLEYRTDGKYHAYAMRHTGE